MRASLAGLTLIGEFEGFRAAAYRDPGSVDGLPITIGYGSTRWEDGSPIQLGQRIDRRRAATLLRDDVADAEAAVRRLVAVPLTQPQFDALASFVYNVGAGAFESSTLRRLLNAGRYREAAEQFARWNRNDGRVLAGLTRRRAAERELFLSELPAVLPPNLA